MKNSILLITRFFLTKTKLTDQQGRDAIANAITEIEASTCIRLKPRDSTNQNDPYVLFKDDGGCWSYIGRTKSDSSQAQTVS